MKKVTIRGNDYYLGDCISGMAEYIPDDSIDLIITDPPYGINGGKLDMHYNRDEGFVLDGYIDVPAAGYQEFSQAWISQAARILRPGGQIYLISGYTHLPEIIFALRQTGLKEINHIIWKYNFGVYTKRKYITSHYHILLYAKPPVKALTYNLESRFGTQERTPLNRSANYADREDVWVISREYKRARIKNKNELPAALLVKMLQYSSRPGDLVCDLFMGGFTTAKACVGLKRRFVGFELSQPAFEYEIIAMAGLKPGYLLNKQSSPVRKQVLTPSSADKRKKVLDV